MTRFLFIASGIFLASQAQANDLQCLVGDSSRRHLVDTFNQAKKESKITQLILQTKTQNATESAAPCADCLDEKSKGMPGKFNRDALASIAKYAATPALIDTRCMEAAAQFVAKGTPEVHCPESGGGGDAKSDSCVTSELVSYQSQVIASLYRCFSKFSPSPVTPAGLFEIHALESAYKPNFSSRKGHGLGQVTNIFIQDVQQANRGRGLLERMTTDPSPDCALAREISGLDLKRTPPLSTPKDRCRFTQIGDGLERNILYSMIGLDTMWRKNLSPMFVGYSNKFAQHPDLPRLMERLSQISYGPDGPVGARAVIRLGRHLSPDRFLQFLDSGIESESGSNLNRYLLGIAARQKDIVNDYIKDPDLKERMKTQGARACLK